jgi:hypothetical protein
MVHDSVIKLEPGGKLPMLGSGHARLLEVVMAGKTRKTAGREEYRKARRDLASSMFEPLLLALVLYLLARWLFSAVF